MPGLPSSVVVKSYMLLPVILFVFMPAGIYAQHMYGLEFAGKKTARELRTSLNLLPGEPLTVADELDLSPDLAFAPGFDSYFGYIFRITNEQGQNTDLIYTHQFEGREDKDVISHHTAMIDNPVWLAQAYSEWTIRQEVTVNGNATGDQLLSPENFYDLLLFDARHHTFKKIYTLKKPEEPMAFDNSMVVDTKEQSHYALTYANDKMESSLQPIKGNLQKPGYVKLGNAIPYQFYDIKSTVALYYYPAGQELIAVTMYTSDHHATQVKINTILFPPTLLIIHDQVDKDYSYLLWGLGILTTLLILLLFRKDQQITLLVPPQEPNALPVFRIIELPAPMVEEKQHASIFLFGHFTIIDKDQNDITKLFSPLVKELFLLIFLHSSFGRKGISSEKINEILWTGRSVKDAKNNRSVNMVKLRNILEKLGHYTLAKENGKWLLTFEEDVYVDIREYQHSIETLVLVSARGGLLMETEYSWLDKFKSDIGTAAINKLGTHLDEHADRLHPEQIIRICDSMLHFDSLCEEAILFKCRALVAMHQHATARNLFKSFRIEYEDIYGEPFEKDYIAVTVN